jgi:hypothetical protein
MIREIVDLIDRNVLYPRLGGNFSFFLRREQVI